MDANNHVKCPDCKALVKLGSVGMANLGCHRGSKKCKANKKKRGTVKALERLQTTACDFFRSRAPPVPAQVILPSPINPTSRPSQSISHTPSNTYSIIPMENLALKGVAVSQDKISAGRDMIHCKRTGYETQWVSLTPSRGKHELTHDFSTIFNA